MILKEYNLSVRLPQEKAIDTGITLVQNDKDVYKLNVRIFDGVNEIDYSEVDSATITFLKRDNNVVQGNMAVEADHLSYTLGTNEIAAPGKLIATIQLLGANERLTTARFLFRVEKDLITEDAVKSTSEFAILQRLKEELEAIDVVDLTNQFNAHKAESVQQGGGVHGLIVEKGTWTPTLNSDQNVELDIQTGSYVRIGDIVHCFMDIQIGNMGSWSGTQLAVIHGLPFVAKNTAPNSVAEYSKINLPGNGKDMFLIMELNTMYLRSNRGSVDGSAVSYVASHFGVGSRIRTSFSYQI